MKRLCKGRGPLVSHKELRFKDTEPNLVNMDLSICRIDY